MGNVQRCTVAPSVAVSGRDGVPVEVQMQEKSRVLVHSGRRRFRWLTGRTQEAEQELGNMIFVSSWVMAKGPIC